MIYNETNSFYSYVHYLEEVFLETELVKNKLKAILNKEGSSFN